jgi:hypothetical protein
MGCAGERIRRSLAAYEEIDMTNRWAVLCVLCLCPLFAGGCLFPHNVPLELGIEGRVVDKATGKPIPNVQILRRGENIARSDPQGRFHIPAREELHLFTLAPNDECLGLPHHADLEFLAPGYRRLQVAYRRNLEETEKENLSSERENGQKTPTVVFRMTTGLDREPPVRIGFPNPPPPKHSATGPASRPSKKSNRSPSSQPAA